MLMKAPKGTKDILPKQVYKWQYIEKKFKDICKVYGYEDIRTPTFEYTELFSRGVGDTSDIVEKQMYTFDDNSGRSLTLRPEGTASVVRAFVENKLYADIQPSKYSYEISCFRYEKPQSGRLREFHQLGIEIFGTDNMMADAEVIALADNFLKELKIENIELQINSIGCPQCRDAYKTALREFLKPNYDRLCDTCKDRYEKNPLRILDCKSEVCREIVTGAPVMLDYLCEDCQSAFEQLKNNLKAFDIEYSINPGIVRGLDYYTKTAFEFVSNDIGAQGTVCGGGRYDNLIEELGGPPISGVGFALGIERLLLAMESLKISIPKPEPIDVLIAYVDDESRNYALKLLADMRKHNIKAEADTLGRNIKGQFKYADRIGAKKTIVIGEDEIRKKKVSVKDMKTGEQKEIDIEQVNEEFIKWDSQK